MADQKLRQKEQLVIDELTLMKRIIEANLALKDNIFESELRKAHDPSESPLSKKRKSSVEKKESGVKFPEITSTMMKLNSTVVLSGENGDDQTPKS